MVNSVTALIWPEIARSLVVRKFLPLRALVIAENAWSCFTYFISEGMTAYCFIHFSLLLSKSGIFV